MINLTIGSQDGIRIDLEIDLLYVCKCVSVCLCVSVGEGDYVCLCVRYVSCECV